MRQARHAAVARHDHLAPGGVLRRAPPPPLARRLRDELAARQRNDHQRVVSGARIDNRLGDAEPDDRLARAAGRHDRRTRASALPVRQDTVSRLPLVRPQQLERGARRCSAIPAFPRARRLIASPLSSGRGRPAHQAHGAAAVCGVRRMVIGEERGSAEVEDGEERERSGGEAHVRIAHTLWAGWRAVAAARNEEHTGLPACCGLTAVRR